MKSSLPTLLFSGALLMAWTLRPVAAAEAAPKPVDCLVASPAEARATAEYGGKTYYFRDPACKEEFLSDPERFSQLYDALLELRAEGKPLQKPAPLDDASLVPS